MSPPRKRLSQGQVEHVLRKTGWPEQIIPKMSAIAMGESGGDPGIQNPNTGHEDSWGLLQINRNAHKGHAPSDLQDPYYNSKVALGVYKKQGLRAWGAYTDGRYKKYFKGGALPDSEYADDGGVSDGAPTAPPLQPIEYKSLAPERDIAAAFVDSQNGMRQAFPGYNQAPNTQLSQNGQPQLPQIQQLGSAAPAAAPPVEDFNNGLIQNSPLFQQYTKWASGKHLLDSPEVQQQFLGQVQQQATKQYTATHPAYGKFLADNNMEHGQEAVNLYNSQVTSGQAPQTQQSAPIEQPGVPTEQPEQQPVEPRPLKTKLSVGFRDKPKSISNSEWFIQNMIPEIVSRTGLEAVDVERSLRNLDHEKSVSEGGAHVSGGRLSEQGPDNTYSFDLDESFVDRIKAGAAGAREQFSEDLAFGRFNIDQTTPDEVATKYGINPSEVEAAMLGQDPKYKEAFDSGQQVTAAYNDLKTKYKAEADDLDSDVSIELKARKDLGLLDETKAQKAIDEERSGIKKIADDNSGKVGSVLYNTFNMATSAIMSGGAVGQMISPDTKPFDYKPYEKAKYDYAHQMSASAGSAKQYLKEAEEAKISGMGLLSESVKTLGRYAAKLPALAPEAVAFLSDVGEQVQTRITGTATPEAKEGRKLLMDSAASWRDMVDKDLALNRGAHYKENFVTNELAEGIAQFAAQTILAPITGGASVLLPAAEASMAQYRQASEAGASGPSRIAATMIGAVAGIPDILLKASWLKTLAPGGVTKFINNFTESLGAKLTVALGAKEAKQVTADTIRAFTKSALKKGGVGFGVESVQEYTEDVINDTYGKFTYNPNLSWKDVFVPTDAKLRGYFSAGITGAFGGAAVAKAEHATSKEMTKSVQVDGLNVTTPAAGKQHIADAMSQFITANETWDKSRDAYEAARKEPTQEARRAARQKAGELYAKGLAQFNEGNDLYRKAQETTGLVGGTPEFKSGMEVSTPKGVGILTRPDIRNEGWTVKYNPKENASGEIEYRSSGRFANEDLSPVANVGKSSEIRGDKTAPGPIQTKSQAVSNIGALTNDSSPFAPLQPEDVQRRERSDKQKALLEQIRAAKTNAEIPSQSAQVETESLVQDKPAEVPAAEKLQDKPVLEAKQAPKLKNRSTTKTADAVEVKSTPVAKIAPKLKNKEAVSATNALEAGMTVTTPKGKGVLVKPVGKKGWQVDYNPKTTNGSTKYQSSARFATSDITADAAVLSSATKTQDKQAPYKKDSWEGFPKAVINTSLSNLTGHKDYNAAKKEGNEKAARSVVLDTLKLDRIEQLAKDHPNAHVLPISSDTSVSKNMLSKVYAEQIADLTGLKLASAVAAKNSAFRTNAPAAWKIMSRTQIGEGDIKPGQEYILADDVITTGGIFNDIKKYVESKGGRVVAVTTLASASGTHYSTHGTVLAHEERTTRRLDKFDKAELNSVLAEYGIKNIDSLTNSEAGYIASFGSIASLKKRLDETAGKRKSLEDGTFTWPNQETIAVVDAVESLEKSEKRLLARLSAIEEARRQDEPKRDESYFEFDKRKAALQIERDEKRAELKNTREELVEARKAKDEKDARDANVQSTRTLSSASIDNQQDRQETATVTYAPPYTLQVLSAPELVALRGKEVKTVHLLSTIKAAKVKAPEQMIADWILNEYFEGQDKINYDLFEAYTRLHIMPLNTIEDPMRDYQLANYALGYQHLNRPLGNMTKHVAVIFNAPLDHGYVAHWNDTFNTNGDVRYDSKKMAGPGGKPIFVMGLAKELDAAMNGEPISGGFTIAKNEKEAAAMAESFNKQITDKHRMNVGLAFHGRFYFYENEGRVINIETQGEGLQQITYPAKWLNYHPAMFWNPSKAGDNKSIHGRYLTKATHNVTSEEEMVVVHYLRQLIDGSIDTSSEKGQALQKIQALHDELAALPMDLLNFPALYDKPGAHKTIFDKNIAFFSQFDDGARDRLESDYKSPISHAKFSEYVSLMEQIHKAWPAFVKDHFTIADRQFAAYAKETKANGSKYKFFQKRLLTEMLKDLANQGYKEYWIPTAETGAIAQMHLSRFDVDRLREQYDNGGTYAPPTGVDVESLPVTLEQLKKTLISKWQTNAPMIVPIAENYQAQADLFKALRPDAKLVFDEHGFSYYSTALTERDIEDPVVVYDVTEASDSFAEREALKDADVSNVFIADVTSEIDENGNLKMSPQAAEMLRQIADELNGYETPIWDAQFWRRNNFAPYLRALEQYVKEAKEYDYTDAELKGVNKLIADVKGMKDSSKGILYVNSKAIFHEQGHQLRYVNSIFEASIQNYYGDFDKTFDATKNLAEKAYNNYFKKVYFAGQNLANLSKTDRAILQEEIFMSIVDGTNSGKLTVAEQAEFIKNDLDAYVEKNGEKILDDLETLINEKDNKSTLTTTIQSLRSAESVQDKSKQDNASVQEGQVDGDKQQLGESPGEPTGQTASPKTVQGPTPDAKSKKLRATTELIAENTSLNVEDVSDNAREYEPKSRSVEANKAEAWLAKVGFDNAYVQVFALPANMAATAKRMAVMEHIDAQTAKHLALGDTGRAKEWNEKLLVLTNSLSPEYTEYGQAISQLARWSDLNPKGVVAHVESKLAQAGKSGTLSLEDQALLREGAALVAQLNAQAAELENPTTDYDAEDTAFDAWNTLKSEFPSMPDSNKSAINTANHVADAGVETDTDLNAIFTPDRLASLALMPYGDTAYDLMEDAEDDSKTLSMAKREDFANNYEYFAWERAGFKQKAGGDIKKINQIADDEFRKIHGAVNRDELLFNKLTDGLINVEINVAELNGDTARANEYRAALTNTTLRENLVKQKRYLQVKVYEKWRAAIDRHISGSESARKFYLLNLLTTKLPVFTNEGIKLKKRDITTGTNIIPYKDTAFKKFLTTDVDSLDFFEKYTGYVSETALDGLSLSDGLTRSDGKWVHFVKGSDYRPMMESVQQSPWCIAGESMSVSYLPQGDFHIFYTNDQQGIPTSPRLAIRMEANYDGTMKLASDLRGVADADQNVESEFYNELEAKIKEVATNETEQKLESVAKTFEDQRKLTEVYDNFNAGKELTPDEMNFILERNDRIKMFGYQTDPRLVVLRKSIPVDAILAGYLGVDKSKIASFDTATPESLLNAEVLSISQDSISDYENNNYYPALNDTTRATQAKLEEWAQAGYLDNIKTIYVPGRYFDAAAPQNTGTILIDKNHTNILAHFPKLEKVVGAVNIRGRDDNVIDVKLPKSLAVEGQFNIANARVSGLVSINAGSIEFKGGSDSPTLERVNPDAVLQRDINIDYEASVPELISIGNANSVANVGQSYMRLGSEQAKNLEEVYGNLKIQNSDDRYDYGDETTMVDLPRLRHVGGSLHLKSVSASNLEYAHNITASNNAKEPLIIGIKEMPAVPGQSYSGRVVVEDSYTSNPVEFPNLEIAGGVRARYTSFPKLTKVEGTTFDFQSSSAPNLTEINYASSYGDISIVNSSLPKLAKIEGVQIESITITNSDVSSLASLDVDSRVTIDYGSASDWPLDLSGLKTIKALRIELRGPVTIPNLETITGRLSTSRVGRVERMYAAGPIQDRYYGNSGRDIHTSVYKNTGPYSDRDNGMIAASLPALTSIDNFNIGSTDVGAFTKLTMTVDAPKLATIDGKAIKHEKKENGELWNLSNNKDVDKADTALGSAISSISNIIDAYAALSARYSGEIVTDLKAGRRLTITAMKKYLIDYDTYDDDATLDEDDVTHGVEVLHAIAEYHEGDARALSSAAKNDGISNFTKPQQDALVAVGKAKQERMRKEGPVKFNAWQSALRNEFSSKGIDPSLLTDTVFKDIFRESNRKQKQENAAKELTAIKKSHKGISDDEAKKLLRERYAKKAEAVKIAAENRKIIGKDKDRRSALDIAIDNEIDGTEIKREDVLLSKDRNKFFQKYAEKLKPNEIHDKYIDTVQVYIKVSEDLKKERAELKVQKSLSPLNLTRTSTESEKVAKNREIANIKRDQMKETHNLRLLVEHYTHRPMGKLARAADWYKRINKSGEAMLTTTLQTASHNLIAQRATKLINTLETSFELAYAKTAPNLFSTSELGIPKNAAFWDIVKNEAKSTSFPGVRKAVRDFHDGEADFIATIQTIIAHKERVVQGLLAYNPDLYDEMIGKFTYGAERDLAAPIDKSLTTTSRRIEKAVRAVESLVHFTTGINRLQEKHFRFATFMGSLATDMKAAGMDIDTVVEKGELKRIPRNMLARAVKRSLEDTFGEDMAKDNDLGRLISGASNVMSWVPFMLNPLLFRRFFYNSTKFMIDHSPLIAYKVVTKEGFTHRDMAKFTTGLTLFAAAVALAGAFGSDDDDPSTITMFGQTLRLTAYNPLSYFMVLGTVVRRMMKGKPAIAQQQDLWKFIGQDPRYPNLAANWWRALLNLGSTTDDAKYVKLGEQSTVLGAKGLTAFLRPLITMKDIIAQFNTEERIIRDYSDEPIMGEFKKTIPLSEIFTRLATGVNTAAKEDVTTGKPLEKYSPLLAQLGVSFINDNELGAKFSPAEEYLHFYSMQQRQRGGDEPYKTAEDRRRSSLTSQLYTAIDKGNDVSQQIYKYQEQGRITDKQAKQLLKTNGQTSMIVRKAEQVDILHNINALAYATPQEYQEILPILLKKAKDKGEDLTKEEYDALLRIMP